MYAAVPVPVPAVAVVLALVVEWDLVFMISMTSRQVVEGVTVTAVGSPRSRSRAPFHFSSSSLSEQSDRPTGMEGERERERDAARTQITERENDILPAGEHGLVSEAVCNHPVVAAATKQLRRSRNAMRL